MGILTAERVSLEVSDNYVFQRSLLAYKKAAELVSGQVLEIGTGSGYGIEIISPAATQFTSIDKFKANIDTSNYPNVALLQMNVPPFTGMKDNSFDYVMTFQVIEHIKRDRDFLKEIHRVLKPGGQLIVSTPNREMSLTRNPWHVREYTVSQFSALLQDFFSEVQPLGVSGNDKIMEYYEQNKRSVRKITRFDIFNFQYLLPRQLLQIPYDILNRINRRRLLNNNNELVTNITMDDYSIAPADGRCFDLFYIAVKK